MAIVCVGGVAGDVACGVCLCLWTLCMCIDIVMFSEIMRRVRSSLCVCGVGGAPPPAPQRGGGRERRRDKISTHYNIHNTSI